MEMAFAVFPSFQDRSVGAVGGRELLVGLPTEGGFWYGIGRRLTSKPYTERKYGIDYDAIVRSEHCNTFNEVVEVLHAQFKVHEQRFIPYFLLYLQCMGT